MLMIIVELPCGNFHNHTKYLSLELSMILILPYIYLVLEFSTLTMKHDNYNSCILSTLLELSFIAMIYDYAWQFRCLPQPSRIFFKYALLLFNTGRPTEWHCTQRRQDAGKLWASTHWSKSSWHGWWCDRIKKATLKFISLKRWYTLRENLK